MKYFSEIVLLTKSYHEEELECWLQWHLNIMHVDHIVVFDNESTIDVKSICSNYGTSVSYYFVSGWPNQLELYNTYIKTSEAEWVLPIDDDEFLYVGNKYNNDINTFLRAFYERWGIKKCYILWTNFYSKDFQKEYSDLYINTHTYYSYEACKNIVKLWKQDNGYGKCFFKNDPELEYMYIRFGKKWVGHSPRCLNGDDTTILVNGKIIECDRQENITEMNVDCFIAHYQFKNDMDWKRKCLRPRADSLNFSIRHRSGLYSILYQYRDTFISCTLLKDLWDKYNENRNIYNNKK